MTCDECADLLLEAEVADLRGDAPGALGSHLARCQNCRRRAGILLHEHERLAQALEALEREAPIRRRRRFGAGRAAALLLPAAAAAGLLFVLRPTEPAPRIDPAVLYAALNPPRPLIETEANLRAAVVTTDEDVTLVLLYQGDR